MFDYSCQLWFVELWPCKCDFLETVTLFLQFTETEQDEM